MSAAYDDMVAAMDRATEKPASVAVAAPATSSGGFGSLFNTFASIAGSAIQTAIPLIATDQATKLKNQRDLDYTRSLLAMTSGSKPNDANAALNAAAQTPAQKWTMNALLYDGNKPSIVGYLVIGLIILLAVKLFKK